MPTSPATHLGDAYTALSPAQAIALWMDHFELSESDVACITGLPLNTVTRLLRGSQSITAAIADALADVTKIAASRWLALQRHHAVWTRDVDNVLDALRGPAANTPTARKHGQEP